MRQVLDFPVSARSSCKHCRDFSTGELRSLLEFVNTAARGAIPCRGATRLRIDCSWVFAVPKQCVQLPKAEYVSVYGEHSKSGTLAAETAVFPGASVLVMRKGFS